MESKIMIQMNYLQNGNRLTAVQTNLWFPRGQAEGKLGVWD